MRIENTIVLVTGGARGLGEHLSRAFAREGARVVVNYHSSEDRARALVSELGEGRALAVEADVTGVVTKAKIKLDDAQLDRVVNLPTYRWTKEFEAKIGEKIAELKANIFEYEAILASPSKLKDVYNGELEELKKLKL